MVVRSVVWVNHIVPAMASKARTSGATSRCRERKEQIKSYFTLSVDYT
jgi:hypothetical protein